MIKLFIAAIITIQPYINNYGVVFIQITNNTNRALYCEILTRSGYGYQDFALAPRAKSYKYIEPDEPYKVECNDLF